jgi:hypothetical protein
LRFLLALLLVAACSTRPADQSEWERENRKAVAAVEEQQVPLPPYPVSARLIEFDQDRGGDFRFLIDPATLSVDDKGVVRYVLVARSRSGVENVSYEALRCEAAQHRVYALGQADRTWSRSRADWRPLDPGTRQLELYADFFCPQKVPISNPAEGVSALREGGHPFAKGFGGDHSLRRD